MILPGSQLYNLILLAFGMLCWGLWASTFRMTSKWRFELYYFDFAMGTLLAALLVGFTFGTFGWDGFALFDDLRIAGKRNDALAIAAGAVFNFGNMLIIGSLSIAGVTVASLIGMGLMLTTGFVITYYTSPSGNGTLLAVGAVMVLGSAVFLAVSSRLHSLARLIVLMREGKTKSTKKVVSIKGLLLAVVGGIFAGVFFPLVNASRQGDDGLGPYALGVFFTLGIVISTFVFNLFFMNLPVNGEPLELNAYFQGKPKSHWLGLFGGMLFYLGLIAMLVLARAEGKNIVQPLVVRVLYLCAPVIGGLIGLFRWNDFKGAEGKVRTFLAVALFLFVAGAVGLSMAANYSTAG